MKKKEYENKYDYIVQFIKSLIKNEDGSIMIIK